MPDVPGVVPARAVRLVSCQRPSRSTLMAREWVPVEPGVVWARVVLPCSVQPLVVASTSCWSALSRLTAGSGSGVGSGSGSDT